MKKELGYRLMCLVAAVVPCARGQIVDVKCCVTNENLGGIGHCVSGPDVREVPSTCDTRVPCVIGFGSDVSLADELCQGELGQVPAFDRAVCSGWEAADVEPAASCLARPMDGIDPHSVFDSDDDGDLDLRDLALFQQFPPLIHSIARPQAAVVQNECCLGESGLRNLGNCMSGPGQTDVPHTCQSAVECEVGFDQPVEGGDYAYQLCDVDGTIMPDASAMCVSWSAAQMPLVDACPASHVPGITAFITFDADGDGDFDLTDYADFQRAVQGD